MENGHLTTATGYIVSAAWTGVNIVFLILCVLIPLTGVILLQIYLSKKENRMLGLILPCLFFVPSVVVTLGFLLFSVSTSVWGTLGFFLLLFIVCNIPTAVLLVIYYAIRGPRKNKKEIDKMNIQDLS